MQNSANDWNRQLNKHVSSSYSGSNALKNAEVVTRPKTADNSELEERQRRYQRNIRKHAIEEEVRRRHDKANFFSRAQARLIAAAAGILLMACVFLVFQQASIEAVMKTNLSLENEYADWVRANKITSSQIEKDIDYEGIYRYAVDVLGLKYPTREQVIYYSDDNASLVVQQEKIP